MKHVSIWMSLKLNLSQNVQYHKSQISCQTAECGTVYF